LAIIGVSNNSGRNGVAIVMSDKAHSALIEWKQVSDRMTYARFKGSAISRIIMPLTSAIGEYGIGKLCTNGERLLRYAEKYELFVTNTCFRYRRKRLVTWNSPDNQHFNQIDYILISSSWKSSVLDSHSYRGAEMSNLHGSDHVMVPVKIRIKLTTHRKQHPPRFLNYLKKFGESERISNRIIQASQWYKYH
uniref:Endo/exonuclease/phosphatase domain-containing protein n=1 Tax=Dracunculus medinensis TaxID=318479 RepID=A0A0N4UFN2_DRAME